MKRNSLNFIDLFAGAGGLSEGFMQNTFNPIAHVEMNSYAAETLRTRACYYYLKKRRRLDIYYNYLRGIVTKEQLYDQVPKEVLRTVINEEMSDKSINRIFEEVDAIMAEDGVENVDVIIGGPPCQAYSLVGRAQDAKKMAADPRNELYKLYARFLNRYNPKMFVFENVPGILTARDGEAWRNLNKYLKRVGYEIDYRELDASTFGVLQKRKRIIIIGWRKESGLRYPKFRNVHVTAVVNDLLSDLPVLQRGHELNQYRTNEINDYLHKNKIRTDQDVLTHHVCRNHKESDVEIYRRTIELWNAEHRRLKYTDLPEELCSHKNRTAFLDRFKVMAGDLPFSHTMLAHISKDGHHFIHPDIEQCRSISVREAARVQSFPDNYYFEGPRTAQFVQIGNAVPPLMAKGIAKQIKKLLQE